MYSPPPIPSTTDCKKPGRALFSSPITVSTVYAMILGFISSNVVTSRLQMILAIKNLLLPFKKNIISLGLLLNLLLSFTFFFLFSFIISFSIILYHKSLPLREKTKTLSYRQIRQSLKRLLYHNTSTKQKSHEPHDEHRLSLILSEVAIFTLLSLYKLLMISPFRNDFLFAALL